MPKLAVLTCSALVSVVGLVTLSGCGDQEIAKAEWVKKTDAICTEYAKKGESVPAPQIADPDNYEKDLPEIATYFKARLALEEQKNEKIRELGKITDKKAEEDRVEMFKVITAQHKKIKLAITAAQERDKDKFEEATNASATDDPALQQRIQSLGLKACS